MLNNNNSLNLIVNLQFKLTVPKMGSVLDMRKILSEKVGVDHNKVGWYYILYSGFPCDREIGKRPGISYKVFPVGKSPWN